VSTEIGTRLSVDVEPFGVPSWKVRPKIEAEAEPIGIYSGTESTEVLFADAGEGRDQGHKSQPG
jgi:hypothetical protein